MMHHRRTPPLWRAWVESQLERPTTRAMLRARDLDVDLVRQVASAEAALARYGVVTQTTPMVAELLQLPVDDVVRMRLLLVHLRAVVMARASGGELVRRLTLPQAIHRGKTLPPDVVDALGRILAEAPSGEPGQATPSAASSGPRAK